MQYDKNVILTEIKYNDYVIDIRRKYDKSSREISCLTTKIIIVKTTK